MQVCPQSSHVYTVHPMVVVFVFEVVRSLFSAEEINTVCVNIHVTCSRVFGLIISSTLSSPTDSLDYSCRKVFDAYNVI